MADTWNSPDKFNREASQWDENPQRRAVALEVAKAIIAATNPKNTMSALEFGCGTGLVTMEIAPLVKSLAAIDTSREMLFVLKEKIRTSGIENIEVSSTNLSSPSESAFNEKSFDLIYSSMTLHHIDDTAGFIIRIANLLSPGGIVALADLDLEDGFFHDDPLEKVHHGFDREALTDLLKAAGLEPLSFETIYTFNKTNRSGVAAVYPVFLVTANKIENVELQHNV
ncbi:MAG: class I SAM-dependent methyltransferase [Chlorobiales bacterium]|nr:class I SAM-dependent methyltransferase [Chlorobiales bacterium]